MRRFMSRFLILFSLLSLNVQGSPAKPKYALSLFHFNLQYVAGDYRIENRIIRESLYPVLQLFARHPRWKINLEIQGYAIEVLGEEHPAVLALLKKLVDRGQIELIVAHYSDQLFIAYPALDLQRSVEISDRVLAQAGLARSRVFSAQELQWSPALAQALQGKYDLLLTSADPNGYYRGSTPPLVRVKYGESSMLALMGGGQKQLPDLTWTWAFLDDGEDFNTADYESDFYRVPEREKKHLDRYKRLQAEGYEFVTASQFARILQASPNYRIADYPFVPEGTWNMDAGGPFLWMGKQRSGVETDGFTRALCYRVRGLVLLAEKLLAFAQKQGVNITKLQKWLTEAWKHLLLSEVSDSSGWTPLLIEVRYTENEAQTARLIVENLLAELFKSLHQTQLPLLVDTQSGEISLYKMASPPAMLPASPPIPVYIRADKALVSCKQIRQGLYRLDIEGMRPRDGAVEIAFDTATDSLFYSPACGESRMVRLPRDLRHNPILALANGFVYLGNGFSLIKDCSVEHLAATWHPQSHRLIFREELNAENPKVRMRFYLLQGPAAAGLALANRINTWPAFRITREGGRLHPMRLLPEALPAIQNEF